MKKFTWKLIDFFLRFRHIRMWAPDKLVLSWQFHHSMGYDINWSNLVTYNEKLQWLKLYDRKPIYTTMVDKYAVKKFIAEKVGEEYVIPTLGVWKHFDDIDFDKLPEQFVLKCTHDSGSTIICKDKSSFNKDKAKEKIEKALHYNYYLQAGEWPYKNVKPQIIAEPLLVDGQSEYPTDYKFYTFNGKSFFFYITSNRGSTTGLCEDFFDNLGNHLEINQLGYTNNKVEPKKPNGLKKMVEISEILAANTYHLRVDFYETEYRIFVGELTFFDGAGFCPFAPDKYNYELGNLITLPKEL